jgi:uncharacterized protein (TIGR03435 family)
MVLARWKGMALKACISVLLGAASGMATAQVSTTANASAATTPIAFEVVSIRQNQSNVPPSGTPQFGPTLDGYRMTGMPLALVIMTAFVPQNGAAMFMPDQIKGLPDWATRDRYDIQARVADKDIPEWQKPAAQSAMLSSMLQATLADRCKLVAHREMKEAGVDLLVIGKGGPKFKETDPADPPPAGVTMPGGAIMVRSSNSLELYGTTMSFFATMLASMEGTGRQIEDRTGLTGRYNIVVKSINSTRGTPSNPGAGAEASDPGDPIVSGLRELGLKLSSSKARVETLLIDHIEKPSEN